MKEARKRVLIVTYYWVPSGGAGVQRWLKFSKYLRDYGWEPVIYTPENPEFPSIDHSFEKDMVADMEIIKTPIWEPYNIYRKLFGKKNEPIPAGFISENKKSGWKEKLSIWIRGNFLIPDPRRFWVRPSIAFLHQYLKKNPVDAIVTTGPPHSMHLIGRGLKKQNPKLRWLADFRDPWTNIDFYKDLRLSKWADRLHHKLERNVIREADAVVVVSKGMAEEYSTLKTKNLHVIPNGFDSTDTEGDSPGLDEKFSLSHIGTLNGARNPKNLWKALAELTEELPELKSDLEIQLIGKTDYSVLESIAEHGLSNQLRKIDYIAHREAIAKQQSSQILLLLINNSDNAKGILTGKFFEYLAARRPILGVGPSDGDAAEVLKSTKAGQMIDFEDVESFKTKIMEYYKLYKQKSLMLDTAEIEKYSRKSLTQDLSEILNAITEDTTQSSKEASCN